ncbi:heavy-metal-associated domain-containing protein [Methylophilus glucosoxydans]|uniref:Heavy-metal-associated domain-containing protein n=2 Tax=Methylophilaceae TaxID=32011 RepID=A0ABW3GID1_9PROT|nr:heavy-metal-associated domain-containing protein [Methylophilus sp. QUAN]
MTLPLLEPLSLYHYQLLFKELMMEFHIENMTCGGCARGVTSAIKAIDPEASITTDPPTRTVKVETSVAKDEIVAALVDAGFPPASE